MVIDDWLFNNENKGRPKKVGGIRMITSWRDLTNGEVSNRRHATMESLH